MDTQTGITSTQSINDQIHAFAKRVKEVDPQAKVILFGSHAIGTADVNSDIDVCIVSDKFGHDYHQGTVSLLAIAHEFTTPMDVIPYTQGDLNNKYDPLAKEIRTQGTVVPSI